MKRGGVTMNKFTYSYPTKVYFGEGSAKEALPVELAHIGNTVMLAYGCLLYTSPSPRD